MKINICGNCVHWWCNDPQELTGFCQRTLSGAYYEDHAECNEYEDKFNRKCRMNKDKLNEAIKTIKEECKAHSICTECPMNGNCNEYPKEWKEVTINDVQ